MDDALAALGERRERLDALLANLRADVDKMKAEVKPW
jgi:hypothetical protein